MNWKTILTAGAMILYASTLCAQTPGNDQEVNRILLSAIEEPWDSDPVDPMQIKVLEGEFALSSGTVLRAGSSIRISEDWMTFPEGLLIEIGKGGVTLKDKDYSEGAHLRVDAEGGLQE